MAANDVVVLRFKDAVLGLPRLRGVVVNVPGPTLSDVLWENGKRTDNLADELLFKVFDPDDVGPEFRALIGKYVQLDDWPSTVGSGASSRPKSPAASGIVRRAYGFGDLVAGNPENGLLEIDVLDGKAVMEVSALVVSPGPITDQGRRSVG